jgi:hypothetical protein
MILVPFQIVPASRFGIRVVGAQQIHADEQDVRPSDIVGEFTVGVLRLYRPQ